MERNHILRKGLAVGIILLFIWSYIIPSSAQNIVEKSSLVLNLGGNHAPIRIIGNNQFTPENGVTGGSGTVNDPYIIENWVIVNDGSASQGIFINDTDVYFIIRNCTISGFHHPDEFRQGIKLSEVTNGRIEETIVTECQTGIDIRYSTENELFNCTCSDYPYQNGYGIVIFHSANITIISSKCYNLSTSIDITESSGITVQKTVCYNNTMWGLFSDALHQNVMRFLIEDCSFKNNGWDGIWFSGSSQNTSYSIIRNCSFYGNNHRGIFLERSYDNIIENCVFDHNYRGMYIDRSENNIIRNCSFLSHTTEGVNIAGTLILLKFARNNEISYCDFIDNQVGLFIFGTRGNKIYHCNISNNSYIGVLSFLSDTRITSNNIFNNGRNYPVAPDPAGVYSWGSFLDVRHNWWGSSQGPSISLFIGIKNWKIVPIRTVDNSDVVMLRNGFALRFPWLSEPVLDAGRQI